MGDWIQAVLGGVCSQDPARAYAPGGVPLPVCARCLGVHLGLLAGAVWWIIVRPSGRPPLAALLGVLAAFVLMGAVGFGGMYGAIHLPADARAATGAVFGATVMAGIASCLGRADAVWSSRATASLPRLAVLAAVLPLAMGRVELQGLAPACAALGVLAGLAAANLVVLAALRRRPACRCLACLVLVAVELAALSAWRVAWRA